MSSPSTSVSSHTASGPKSAKSAPAQGSALGDKPRRARFVLTDKTKGDLEFGQVTGLLYAATETPYGDVALATDVFCQTPADAERRMDAALEAADWVAHGRRPLFDPIADVRGHLREAATSGVLEAHAIVQVARTMGAISAIQKGLEARRSSSEALCTLMQGATDWFDIARGFRESFAEDGTLLDNASRELAEVRTRLRQLQGNMRERMEGLVDTLGPKGHLQELYFTMRGDRYCLPVKAEHKSRVPGILHDTSQTGHTFFIEPQGVVELGNRITVAHSAVKAEEARLLRLFTEELVEYKPALLADLARVGQVDAAFARGVFTHRTGGQKPQLGGTKLDLRTAKHPLLVHAAFDPEAALDPRAQIVGNHIRFAHAEHDAGPDGKARAEANAAVRGLIVSGPNAGGKTIALKTAGLLALMARAGLPVPASPDSQVPFFGSVFASIGDAQSLDGALSTFSGQIATLTDMLATLEKTGQRTKGPTLVLLDEILNGTDAKEGAALARACVEALVDTGAYVMVTTHYGPLKALGLEGGDARFVSAYLELNRDVDTPTFRLRYDGIGSASALKIARRYGLPEALLARAELLLHGDEDTRGGAVTALIAERESLRTALKTQEELTAKVKQTVAERDALVARLVEERDQRKWQERDEIVDALAAARAEVAKAIRVAQSGGDAKALTEASHALKAQAEAVQKLAPKKVAVHQPVGKVSVGDRVWVEGFPATPFEVEAMKKDGTLTVRQGLMRMRVQREQISLKKGGQKPQQRKTRSRPVQVHTAPRGGDLESLAQSEPRASDNTLDLRGKRVEPALESLERFLDNMMNKNRSVAYVLHGHGTGAMKQAVREALAVSAYAGHFGPAGRKSGGDAITVVALKG